MMKINKRIKSDKGSSVALSFLIILPFVIVLLISIIDVGVFYLNKNVMVNAVQTGAKITAIYGGTGNTIIAQKYGNTTYSGACTQAGANNAVECNVFNDLQDSGSLINVKVTNIDCGPNKTSTIGTRTYCEVKWTYAGIPMSALSMFNLNGTNTTRMTSESEVLIR